MGLPLTLSQLAGAGLWRHTSSYLSQAGLSQLVQDCGDTQAAAGMSCDLLLATLTPVP